MLTPSEYKKRYENIDVLLKNGEIQTVSVNRYRLAPGGINAKARDNFLKALDKHGNGIDTPLRIDTVNGIVRVDPGVTRHEDALKKRQKDLMLSGTGESDWMIPATSRHGFVLSCLGGRRDARPLGSSRIEPLAALRWNPRMNTRIADWHKLARYVFVGKGSPEACQVVLELANAWGLAPDVQDYAGTALGLDCNGFVGNYLWHVNNSAHSWTELGVGDHDLGPDSPMRTGFYDRYQHHLLDRWESLDASKKYIMLEVNTSGVVVNRGDPNPQNAGHIVITEPNRRAERAGADGKKTFAVWSVEATAGHTPQGLWESWYTCTSYDSKNKVFNMFREGMDAGHKEISVKIAAVS